MKSLNIWKLSTVALSGALIWVFLSGIAAAERDQKSKIALKNLMTAEMNLVGLPDDADGHRAKALKHVQAGIGELRQYVRGEQKR